MLECDVTILNKSGMHTRPAAALVKLASQFRSDFFIQKDGYEINGKSIIGVMTLAAEKGATLHLVFEGSDEENAMTEILELFTSGFGEM
jgi:phosphocarrier protein HPr